MTQQQLAVMLGVHPMTLSKWERAQANPASYHLQQLLLLEQGARELGEEQRRQVARLLAIGLAVAALAIIIAPVARAEGQRRGWW